MLKLYFTKPKSQKLKVNSKKKITQYHELNSEILAYELLLHFIPY